MMISPRQERAIAARDAMETGGRAAPLVPRTFIEAQAFCGALAQSDLIPQKLKDRAADVLVLVLAGMEIGLTPMASIRLHHVIEGIPRLSADGLGAIILTSSECEYLDCVESTDQRCTWVTKRRGRPERSCTWTIERAKRAGLTEKRNRDGSPGMWSKYPENMLSSRAKAELCRLVYPDIAAGLVSLEEARDGDFIEANAIESKPVFAAPPTPRATFPDESPVLLVGVQPKPSGPPPGVPSTEAPPKRGPGRPPKEKPADPTPAAAASRESSPRATVEPQTSSSATSAGSQSNSPASSSGASEVAEKKPDAPTEGSEPEGAAPPTGAPPAPDDDWGEDPVDAGPPKKTIEDFFAWLKSCKSQKEIAKDLAAWKAWSHEQAADGDVRFAKGGANAVAMTEAYARRKAEVPA